MLPAILLSGLTPQPFMFMGFPPEKTGERTKLFESLKNFPYTLCFYISPHKAEKHITEMIQSFGDRKAALVREISKVFQEAIRENLSGVLAHITEGIKGELVLVIEGCNQNHDDEKILWHAEVDSMLEEGLSVKNIVKEIESNYNVPRNEIKQYALNQR